MADFDGDGRPDLFAANGHVLDNPEVFDPTAEYPEPNLLLRNAGPEQGGSAVFADVSGSSGPGLRIRKVSRGAAFGDYDNDGDVDLFVVNNNQRADLLRNDGPAERASRGGANHWLSVRLVGGAGAGKRQEATGTKDHPEGSGSFSSGLAPRASRLSNRDGIGARVTVTAGGRRQTREVHAGSGYLSCNDKRLHFGLGRSPRADRIEVRWPGGGVTRIEGAPADREVTVEEGAARWR
jgi:hypothetical protein